MINQLRVVALVPAYNEQSSIAATIMAVLAQERVPDEIVVIPNGCSDDTAAVARKYPVTVLELPRLEHKKSEALNTAWLQYGQDADIVICLDADTVLPANAVGDWEQEFIADAHRGVPAVPIGVGRREKATSRPHWWDQAQADRQVVEPAPAWWDNPRRAPQPPRVRERALGGSSSKFTMLGTDFLTRLQRAEFSRWTDTALRRGWTSVLAGTGAAISGEALRQVAARDDREGPWPYTSQVEDFELTYRIRELGYRCQVSPTVRAYTDSMKTVKALWGQRMKWQVGTIEDLVSIGVNRLTLVDWLQQLSGIFAAAARYLWLVVILALCLVGDLNFQWIWWVLLPLFFIAVQVKHALRIPHRDRADLIHAFLIYPAEAFAWLRAGWFTAAWVQAPISMLIGRRKDRWQAQYSAEAFKRSLVGRFRRLGARVSALAATGLVVMLSVGNLYPASGLPTVAAVSKLGLAESLSTNPPTVCKGYVALTYDDGPTQHTTATSNLLRRHGLHATFFLTGGQIEQNREAVSALVEGGHRTGVRAESGLPEMTARSQARTETTIDHTSQLIEEITGRRPVLFRPAYGPPDEAVSTFVARRNMREVPWTIDADDLSGKTASEIGDAVAEAKDGDIILMHDNSDRATRAVPLISATLRQRGLCTGRILGNTTGHDIGLSGGSHTVKVVPL